MSKLSDLRSKGTIITLSNGLELEIRPMSLTVEADVGELYDEEAKISQKNLLKAIRIMVTDAIKTSLPDATDEEIDNLNKNDLKLITNMVLKVNGLGGDPEKK